MPQVVTNKTADRQSAMADNIREAFMEAEACRDCKRQGSLDWYTEMGRWIRSEAKARDCAVEPAFAAFAVLSTNAKVDENMRNFSRWLDHKSIGHFGDVKRRLLNCRRGNVARALAYIQGRKIVSFNENLRFPWRNDVVTIDRHAMRLAVGGCPRTAKNALTWVGGYEDAMQAYLQVGHELGLFGHEIQALTWCHLVYCKGAQ